MRTMTYETKRGIEFTFQFPTKKEICERCHGEGKHVNPSIDGNGLTSDDLADDDFREAYLSGFYDVPCEECDGLRVTDSVDHARLTPRQRRAFNLCWDQFCELRNEKAAERRMRERGIQF